MRRWLALGLVASLAFAACGGGDDDSTTSGDGTSVTDDGGSGGDNTTDDTDADTGNDELDALLEKQASAVIRVTYENQDGSTFTVSQDGENRAVIQEGGDKFLEVDGSVYTCTGGDTAQCMELPDAAAGLGSMVTGLFGLFAVVAIPEMGDNPLFDVTTSEDREVAGRDATCTTLEAGRLIGSAGSITACLDDETGVFLLGETEGDGGESRIEAVEVGEPQDSDFELTGEIMEIPGT